MTTFFNTNNEMLDLYTKAITKAHGEHHPEVFDVRRLYQDIQEKGQHQDWDLREDFRKLRAVTNNYTIPDDACETMAKTYHLLEEFDRLSQA